MTAQPLMILIAGPYRSGTRDDPVLMERNLRTLEAAALPLYRAGDIPVIGECSHYRCFEKPAPSDPAMQFTTKSCIRSPTAYSRAAMACSVFPVHRRAPMKMCAWQMIEDCWSGTA